MKAIALFLLYFAIAFLGVFGPPLLKLALTGSVGVNTSLFATMVLAPGLFLLLGAFIGRRVFVLHVACQWGFGSIAFFLWILRDVNPWKDLVEAQQLSLFFAFFAAYLGTAFLLPQPTADRFFSAAGKAGCF